MPLNLPIGFLELTSWLAFTCLVLLLTSEVLLHIGAAHGLLIDKTKLRLVGVITAVMLLLAIILRVYDILHPGSLGALFSNP